MFSIIPNILNNATCPLLYHMASIMPRPPLCQMSHVLYMPHILNYATCHLLCYVLHYVKCHPLMSHVLYMPHIFKYATCPLLCQMSSIMPHIFNYATRTSYAKCPKMCLQSADSAITTWPNIILYIFLHICDEQLNYFITQG